MKLEITHVMSSKGDGETLTAEIANKHDGEITIIIKRQQIVDLLDQAASNLVITVEDLECVLSRIRRGGRTVHKRLSK